MAVHREHRLVAVRNALDQLADGVTELLGNGVADGVGNIDGAGAGIDDLLDNPAEKIDFRAAGILAGEFNIGTQVAGVFHCLHRRFDHFVRLHPQLVLHMDRAGGNKGMDATTGGIFQRFTGAVDIRFLGPGQ